MNETVEKPVEQRGLASVGLPPLARERPSKPACLWVVQLVALFNGVLLVAWLIGRLVANDVPQPRLLGVSLLFLVWCVVTLWAIQRRKRAAHALAVLSMAMLCAVCLRDYLKGTAPHAFQDMLGLSRPPAGSPGPPLLAAALTLWVLLDKGVRRYLQVEKGR